MDFIDLLIEQKAREQKYFLNYKEYASVIKQVVEGEISEGKPKVLVFGSVVKGTWIPNRSDIDILVVSEKVEPTAAWQSELRRKIFERLGDWFAPFEVHFATPELYRTWYSKFIGDSFVEV
jgi:predicted nucleotidyltransferase